MKFVTRKLLTIAVTAALFAPMAAMATNGYFAHGYGTKNKGLAGSGVALPQDAMIAATNPAGMVFVGNRLDVGAAIFSPNPRSYSATGSSGVTDGTSCASVPGGMGCPFEIGPQSIESEDGIFLIPHFARNWMLDANSSLGVSVYGNGGMNTEYKGGTALHDDGTGVPGPGGLGTATTTSGTYGAGTAGVNLEQLFIATTYARKINNTASWGVTPILVYQRFEAKGLALFGARSVDGANLSDNGVSTSTGYGLKLGVQGEATPGVTLAASYQSKMSMSEFDEYAGLFADDGDFDIPATATVGVAWATSPRSVLTADIQKIFYSDVPAISNPISNMLTNCTPGMPGTGAGCLGASDGAGFGWEDMTIVKLGYQWASSNGWTWRAGVSKGSQPIPSSEVVFNILAPAVIEKHFTFGFTKEVNAGNEFNFAAMYAPNVSLKGPNPLDPAQTIEIEMAQWEIEGSWGVKF